MRPYHISFAAVTTIAGLAVAADTDFSEYLPPGKAVAAKIAATTTTTTTAKPGFLGVHVAPDAQGQLAIASVAADSPAAKAGVKVGDLIVEVDGTPIKDEDAFRDAVRGKMVGDSVALALKRGSGTIGVRTKLEAPTRTLPPAKPKAILGVQVVPAKDREGVVIDEVSSDTPAERAKLKVGETLLKIDDAAVTSAEKLSEVLAAKKPDDTVTLTLFLSEKAVELKLKLGSDRPTERGGFGGGGGGGGGRFGGGRPGGGDQPRPGGDGRPGGFAGGGGMRAWTKPTFRLGIIGVEYPDVKHNPKITPEAWEESMFSEGVYTKKSVTGQTVYGSLRDYYIEQSFGALKVEGKAFPFVEVSKKRAEYNTGPKATLLTEALDKLIARDGEDALKDLDGVFFIYAGANFQVPRGSLYWPHRSTVRYKGKAWPYFICPEGGERMGSISVFCHEFGHMIGLPDLYAQPENPGMEGSGVWSAMANQVGNGRPQHFCAWSKEKLGWVKPTVIDPAVKQKLILPPVEDSPANCYKVLCKPDGSEYLLLENRKKTGFDVSLPADGLLIWRVVGGRPFLQESHGVEGPRGPAVFLDKVPYPSVANDAYTPFTTPSSRSPLGGGLPVYITNIRRLPDDRITFHVGYEYH
ncbi:MAG: M6 family metalloprotease domain-containing protein [Gemmataceae bacterium]